MNVNEYDNLKEITVFSKKQRMESLASVCLKNLSKYDVNTQIWLIILRRHSMEITCPEIDNYFYIVGSRFRAIIKNWSRECLEIDQNYPNQSRIYSHPVGYPGVIFGNCSSLGQTVVNVEIIIALPSLMCLSINGTTRWCTFDHRFTSTI